MTLAKRFVRARITELREGVFELAITYSYYSIYDWVTISIYETLEAAKDALIKARCGDYLAINKEGSVITLGT